MARRALSAERAIKVLNHLAANPERGHTMSELGRELGVNSASMHAVLSALLADGYVAREPGRKTYRLGSSLVAVGQAALDDQPAIRRVREETQRLAGRLGLECVAAVFTAGSVLVVGEAGREERLHLRPRVGQRLPFMPPIGIIGAATLPEPEREEWLARLGPGHDAEKAAYRRAGDAMLARGVEIGLETPTRRMIGMLMAELLADPRSPELRAKLNDLVARLGREEAYLIEPEPGRTYAVNNFSVPIYGPHREHVAGLALLGFENELDADLIREYASTLIGACRSITLETGGRMPLRL